MSIPSYQLGSLSGDNVAKSRVMKRSKVAFETETQRAVKKGKSKDDANNLLKLINQNLQLQITALTVAEASIVQGEIVDDEEELDILPEIQSGFLSSMGRAITLSFELKSLLQQFAPTYQNADVGGVARMQGLLAELTEVQFKILDTVERQQALADVLGVAKLDVDRLFAIYGKSITDCGIYIQNILSKGYSSDTKDIVLDTVGRETEILFERLGIPFGEDFGDDESSNGFTMASSVRSSRSGIRGLNRGRLPAFSVNTGSAQSAQLLSGSDSDEESIESSEDEGSSVGSQVSGRGLSGGILYEIPHYRKIHNMSASYALPVRYA